MGGTIIRAAEAGVTGGLSEFAQKNPFGAPTGGIGGLFGGGGGYSAPTIGGKQTPQDILMSSGGAPLLANIAMGANVDDAMASFLGVPKDQLAHNPAIQTLRTQLTDIQSNTDMKNQAVNKLVQDFPNFMADNVQKYGHIMDDATSQMMNQALSKVGANYAAGGQLSSGATAAAAARAGASIAEDKVSYGTNLALNDWQNQYNTAAGLQSFQQKMLGQGAQNGFNAVQNALNNNVGIDNNQAQLDIQANNANQSGKNALLGTLGQLGGTALGAYFGGPVGAKLGSTIGSSIGGGGSTGSPRLSLFNNGGSGLARYS